MRGVEDVQALARRLQMVKAVIEEQSQHIEQLERYIAG